MIVKSTTKNENVLHFSTEFLIRTSLCFKLLNGEKSYKFYLIHNNEYVLQTKAQLKLKKQMNNSKFIRG